MGIPVLKDSEGFILYITPGESKTEFYSKFDVKGLDSLSKETVFELASSALKYKVKQFLKKT
jgi:hypothetical protein